jgi:AraC family transcriptional regulator
MGYREDMENCRDYIDAHLDEEIELRALSERFGYSFYHFCHVFRSCNGMSAGEYLRHRRLCRAAVELSHGRSVTEAALNCGFDTPSGFTRAFCRRFGMTPSAYKKMKGGILHMTPEIKKMAGFAAIGYVLKPENDLDALENGAYWLGKDFSSVSKEDYASLTYPGYAEVGAWIRPGEKTGELYYFLGPTVKNKSFIPDGMETLEVPEAQYAVFTVPRATDPRGLHEAVKKTWKFIFSEWFDGSSYKFDQTKQDFEYYLGEDTYIYVPVTPR